MFSLKISKARPILFAMLISAIASGLSSSTFALSSPLATSIFHVVEDFFKRLWLYPGENSQAVLILGAVVVGAFVGLAFLTKKIYDRCVPAPE